MNPAFVRYPSSSRLRKIGIKIIRHLKSMSDYFIYAHHHGRVNCREGALPDRYFTNLPGTWAVKVSGSDRAGYVHSAQKETEKAAKQTVRNLGGRRGRYPRLNGKRRYSGRDVAVERPEFRLGDKARPFMRALVVRITKDKWGTNAWRVRQNLQIYRGAFLSRSWGSPEGKEGVDVDLADILQTHILKSDPCPECGRSGQGRHPEACRRAANPAEAGGWRAMTDPYFLQSLGLSGFRAYLQQKTFDFSKKRCLAIFAPNGSGKSSIIDALEFMFSKDGTLERLGQRTINNQAGPVALAHNLAEEAKIAPTVTIGVVSDKGVAKGARSATGAKRPIPAVAATMTPASQCRRSSAGTPCAPSSRSIRPNSAMQMSPTGCNSARWSTCRRTSCVTHTGEGSGRGRDGAATGRHPARQGDDPGAESLGRGGGARPRQ